LYQTARRNIPEDGNLHTRRRENMKFHPFCDKLLGSNTFVLKQFPTCEEAHLLSYSWNCTSSFKWCGISNWLIWPNYYKRNFLLQLHIQNKIV
jgi:hypothetical protein